MAQDMFSRWDKEIDTEGLQKDVAEAAANGGGGNYKEVPHGILVDSLLDNMHLSFFLCCFNQHLQ